MIHWAWLILAFFGGAAACYGIIYRLAKVAARVEAAVEEAARQGIH